MFRNKTLARENPAGLYVVHMTVTGGAPSFTGPRGLHAYRRANRGDADIHSEWPKIFRRRLSQSSQSQCRKFPSRQSSIAVKAAGKSVNRELSASVRCALADHRSAIGIHVGFIFVMIHAPPKAISPAY